MKPGIPRFVLVAPLQMLQGSEPILYTPPADAAFPRKRRRGVSQSFEDRQYYAPFTSIERVENIELHRVAELNEEKICIESNSHPQSLDFYFDIKRAEIYEHFGMEILISVVELSNRSDLRPDEFGGFGEDECVSLEYATTQFMKKLCTHLFETEDRRVRWVGRTVVFPVETLSGEVNSLGLPLEAKIPDKWFQEDPDGSVIKLADGTWTTANWGNSGAWTVDFGYQFVDLCHSSALAQFLWCFIADVETSSVEMLGFAYNINLSLKDLDSVMESLVQLNYNLALASMFYERLGTESSPFNRTLVTAILEAWGFNGVFENVSERLERLEKIFNARTQNLARRSGRLTENILFVLSLTGVISLTLTLIGTAFSGERATWMPTGQFFEAFRTVNLDIVMVVSLLISVLLLAWGFKSRRPKKGK